MDDEEFLSLLRSSLEYWSLNDFTSAWVRVPTCRASLVERLTSIDDGNANVDVSHRGLQDDARVPEPETLGMGFDLHHVNATTQTIVLKKWLKPLAEDKIPPFATHQVGVAGFVLSDNNELLLVKEWTTTTTNATSTEDANAPTTTLRVPSKMWKLPGGLLDAGESFGEAAIREVYEETGVRCEFESMLTFWHRHGLTYGQSDVYVVCLLRLAADDDDEGGAKRINIDPVEISDAMWMNIDDFLQTQEHPLILHVLRSVFRLDDSVKGALADDGGRIRPRVEIAEGFDVKFRSRALPFPTYTAKENE